MTPPLNDADVWPTYDLESGPRCTIDAPCPPPRRRLRVRAEGLSPVSRTSSSQSSNSEEL